MKKLCYLLSIGTAFMVGSCSSDFEQYPASNKDGLIIIEAEKMTLTKCDIVDVEGGGGKAVKVLEITSSAEFKMKLKAGTYLANVYVNAPDATQDGFWLVVNDLPPSRSFPNKHNQWRYLVNTLTFAIEKDGEHVIKFTPTLPNLAPGESGFLVDRIEIINTIPPSLTGPVTTKWTNPVL